MIAFVDYLEETALLIEVLRDAVCNESVNENASVCYWVLIDLIGERVRAVQKQLEGVEGGV